MHIAFEFVCWGIAVAWCCRVLDAAWHMPRVPDLLADEFDRLPAGMPGITVIVPARDEVADIGATLRSLLKQDYANVQIIAVNDRSTDETGPVMEKIARGHEDVLRIIHVRELPEGWLGKTHAMALAARQATTEWLLFTDGDVTFAPDALRRTLVHAQATGAEHMVTMPTMMVTRWDEGMVLGFFQVISIWAARPWRVNRAKSGRDCVGIGAFNMIRRDVYTKIGGFETLRMEVLEDVRLARIVNDGGHVQKVAFGRDLVRVHWAVGALGLVRVLTKNIFSAFRFRPTLLLLGCVWMAMFCVWPAVELLYAPTRVPGMIALLAVAGGYAVYAKRSGISPGYVWLFPSAALLFIYTMLRSMRRTLKAGGVIWRGTFYKLDELKKSAGRTW